MLYQSTIYDQSQMDTFFSKTFLLLVLTFLMLSCEKDPDIILGNRLEGLTKLKEGYASGASVNVQIWGKKNFFMGYNKLTVVVLDSLNPADTIKDAQIQFMPVMTMTSGTSIVQHNCPVENPASNAVDGVFTGAIAFVMPSSTGGKWNLNLSVQNKQTNKSGTAQFDILVDNPGSTVMKIFTSQSADSSKLVLSLVEPLTPKVGMNTIEFTLHRKVSMISWPADSTYGFVITPEMPSMGHGSPNNVNPVHIGNGHYKGKVNFTMTGEWKLNIDVQKNGNTISDKLYFNLSL